MVGAAAAGGGGEVAFCALAELALPPPPQPAAAASARAYSGSLCRQAPTSIEAKRAPRVRRRGDQRANERLRLQFALQHRGLTGWHYLGCCELIGSIGARPVSRASAPAAAAGSNA